MAFNPRGLPRRFDGHSLSPGGLGGPFTGGVDLDPGVRVHFHGADLTTVTGAYIKGGPDHGACLNEYEAAITAIGRKTFSR